MDELSLHLTRFSRRIHLRECWQLAQKTLWVAFLFGVLLQILGRILPIKFLDGWTLLSLTAWVMVILSIWGLKRQSLLKTAQRVDIELKLKERLSTALTIEAGTTEFPSLLITAQREDALSAARKIQEKSAFPLQSNKRQLGAAGIMLVVLLVLVFIFNPMDVVIAQENAVEQAAQEEAEKIEQLEEQIKKDERLSEEERQALLDELAQLATALKTNPGDLEQAMADISKLEKSLQERQTPNSAAQAANLQSLMQQLQAFANQEEEPELDLAEAAEKALNELAEQISSMDEGQRQELAQALAQMAAQAAQSGNQQLAQALASMAQAMQAGDAQAAAQAAQNAAQAITQAQQSQALQQALQNALNQMQSSRSALSQAAQSAAMAAGQRPGQGQNPGQSPGISSGQGAPGQGQSGSQGQPGGPGGGTQATALPPNTGVGVARPPQGQKPGTTGADISPQIYTPFQFGPPSGSPLTIPGQDTGQGQTQTSQSQSQLPGAFNPALVPYYQVFNYYLNVANLAMQQAYIPPALLQYIQLYFLSLQPASP